MQNLHKRATTLFVGWLLFVCGVAGLFLPIVPGVPLLLAGVFILFSDCERLGRVTGTFRTHLLRLAHFFERFNRWKISGGAAAPITRMIQIAKQRLNRRSSRRTLEETSMRQQIQEVVQETYAMGARRKVLIFDEDVEALAQHAEPFEARGIEVHRCTTVEAAMRSVQREDFDLALVDRGSSGFEGRRVIGYLVRYNLRTPFIVLARRADAEWYEQGLALGAVDCLKKPVMAVEMNWIIQRFLSRRTSLTK